MSDTIVTTHARAQVSLTQTEINTLNRLSAAKLTQILQIRFGVEYFAVARKGYRAIGKNISPMCADFGARAPSWVEALRLARGRYGWVK